MSGWFSAIGCSQSGIESTSTLGDVVGGGDFNYMGEI